METMRAGQMILLMRVSRVVGAGQQARSVAW
jgi:hypothetical protein